VPPRYTVGTGGRTRKPKKVKRTTPVVSTAERAAASSSTRKVSSGRKGRKLRQGYKDAVKAKKYGVSIEAVRKERKAHPGRGPSKSQKRLLKRLAKQEPRNLPKAEKMDPRLRYARDLEDYKAPKDQDLFRMDGKTQRRSDYAPTGLKIIRALTGDEPGKIAPTGKEFLNVGAVVAGGGAGAVARSGAAGLRVASKSTKVREAARGGVKARAAAKTDKAKRTAAATRATEKAVARHGRKTGKLAKQRQGKAVGRLRQGRAKTKARYSAPQRKLRRAQRTEGAANRAINPATGAFAASEQGRKNIQGLKGADKGELAKATGRAVYGMPAAVVGDAIDLATGHPGKFLESQKEYLKTLEPFVSGSAEQIEQTIEKRTGIVPHLTLGLGAYAAGKRALRGRQAPSVSRRRVERDARLAREGKTPTVRREAKKRLGENREGEPLGQRHRGRKRESERSAVAAELETGLRDLEMKEGGKRRLRPARRIEREIAELADKRVTRKVSEADVVNYLARHRDIDLEGVNRERARLHDPKRPIDPDDIATRDVLDALAANPRLLTDKRIQRVVDRLDTIQRERSIERHTERTGEVQTTPDPRDARAKYLPVMRERDILSEEERIPPGLRGEGDTWVAPKPGRHAGKAIRAEANGLRSEAVALERRAAALRRNNKGEEAAEIEGHAERLRIEAEARLAVVDRHRRANSLEMQAARKEKAGSRAEARRLRVDAEKIRALADKEQAKVRDEAIREVVADLEAQGRREPVYLGQRDVARTERTPSISTPATRGTKKEKFREGTLEAEGRVDESAEALLETLYRGRSAITERWRQRGFIEDQFLRDGDQRLFTGDEITAMQREGRVPPGYDKVEAKEFAPAFQKNEALRRELESKRLAVKATEREGRIYGLAPHSAIKEYGAQAKQLGGVMRGVRAASRAQTITMLAGSVPWFLLQTVATPLVIGMRNPNPIAWVRAARNGIDILRRATPRERRALWAHIGGNPSDFLSIGENVRGINATTIASHHDAISLAFRSPVGRMAHAIGENIRKGGPLIAVNRRYEAAWRKFDALLEMDRRSGVTVSGRPRAFAAATSKLTDTLYSHLDEMKGKRGADQAKTYLKNERLMRDIENDVNDAIGNWAALTAAEKKLASVVAFYPFVRFSLGWIAKFPKNNPLKTAVYLNLAQQNAQELSMLLGGDPSFWTGWATAVHHAGGEPSAIDLSRAVPGGNAFTEALAEGMNPVQAGLRLTQPIIGSTIAAAYGKDEYGNDLPEDVSLLDSVAENIAGLPAPTREINPLRHERGRIGQLFRAIEDRNGLERTLLPDAFPDIAREAEAARLSRLLDIAFAYDKDDETNYAKNTKEYRQAIKRKDAAAKAWNEIDKMLIAYEVETKAQQKKSTRQYFNRKDYGPDSRGGDDPFAADNPFGGGGDNPFATDNPFK
jgi:hypothetical protein